MLVTCHRPKSWPADAIGVSAATQLGEQIGASIDAFARRERLPRPAVVVLNSNRRQMLTIKRSGKWFELRIGLPMLAAPDLVVSSVCFQLRHGRFPDELSDFLQTLQTPAAAPRKLRPSGRTVDLRDALESVTRFLPTDLTVPDSLAIGWARRTTGKRRSIRLGSATTQGQIRIHPVLDSADVPEYVLHMVVYHELCHCLRPPLTRTQAKRQREHRIHHSEFRALEARFPRLDEANAWVRDNLDSLLHSH